MPRKISPNLGERRLTLGGAYELPTQLPLYLSRYRRHYVSRSDYI